MLNRDFLNKATKQEILKLSDEINNYITQENDWGSSESVKNFINTIQLPPSENDNQRPPPPEDNNGQRPPPPEDNSGQRSPPPDLNQHRLRFGLTDQHKYTLIPFKHYKNGDKVADSDINMGEPIYLDGEVVAFIIPDGNTTISDANNEIIETINKIINYNIVLALIIALIVGITTGSQLTRSIRKLTTAAESLGKELEGQQVTDIKSQDEIGILAKVLNKMSLELEKSHKEIRALSITDELTGLYNRRFFNEQIKILLPNSLRNNQPLSIVLTDIDFFKKVNDTFSHLIGDEVLKKVSQILQTGVREGDLTARFGGEEFILSLHDTDEDTAFKIIERIRKCIEDYDWGSIESALKITMSFGISTESTPTDYMKMIETADARLYKAKESGRNRTINK